jgi:hypothetical protein
MIGWPAGKGPLAGFHPGCGGKISVRWKGIQPEYWCEKCGECMDHPGHKPRVDRIEVKHIVDYVWKEIGRTEVDYRTFILLIDQVCFQTLNGHFPVLKVSEFNSWGYEIVGTRIKRKP